MAAPKSKPAPAPKTHAKPAAAVAKPVIVATPAPRKPGKVAVAVAAKPAAPVQKAKFRVVPYQTDEASGRPIVPAGYKPAADEEYMSLLQLEYFRQKLLARRAELVVESKQTIEIL